MKYLRVITVVVVTFIFLAALAIGLGVIFAVKNINVSIQCYTETEEEATTEISLYKGTFLDLYKGKLISSVSEDDFAGYLTESNSNYTLSSFEKQLPCTINITLLERRETYVFQGEDGSYNLYDLDGAYIRTAEDEDGIMNTTGDTPSPNVMLYLPDESYVPEAASLGRAFHDFFSASFDENAPIRSTVESICIVERTASIAGNNVIFQLRSGIQVMVYDYEDFLNEKMEAAYEQFKALSAVNKLSGYIYCFYDYSGQLNAAYQPSGKAATNL